MNSSSKPLSPPAWRDAGSHAAGQLPDSGRRAALAAFLAESASLAPLLMLHGLMRLEFCTGEGWRIDERRRELRIDACYDGLLDRWHRLLLEEGLLDVDEACWTLAPCAPAAPQLEQRIDDARHRLRQLMNWLDDAAPLADALFGPPQQIDDWLFAPSLAGAAPSAASLHQLLHLPGIVSDYFAGIAASVLPPLLRETAGDAPSLLALGQTPPPLAACFAGLSAVVVPVDTARAPDGQLPDDGRHDAVVASDLLGQPNADNLLAGLGPRLNPGAVLLLLQTIEERPLHWVSPAAVQAHACAAQAEPHDEHRCRQALQRAGFALLQVWPQADAPMAFTGQRLFVARYDPT